MWTCFYVNTKQNIRLLYGLLKKKKKYDEHTISRRSTQHYKVELLFFLFLSENNINLWVRDFFSFFFFLLSKDMGMIYFIINLELNESFSIKSGLLCWWNPLILLTVLMLPITCTLCFEFVWMHLHIKGSVKN